MALYAVNDSFHETLSNLSLPATPAASSPDEDCKSFIFIIYVPVFGTVGVFGLVGNTLSWVVLQWEKRNHVATFLLVSLCLADNLFLGTTVSVQVFSGLGNYFDWAVYDHMLPFLMVYVWPLIHITQFGTVWMTVLVAANRYIAICLPFKAHKLCSLNRVRIQVCVMALVAILYNIPRFFEYTIVYQDDGSNSTRREGVPTHMKLHPTYLIAYENVLYCLFVFLGPLVILIILNVRLVRELFRARQRLIHRHIPIPGEEEEQNLTLVMVVIIIIFVVCQTPAFINALLNAILGEHGYVCGKPYFYFYHLSNLLVSANSAANFIIYFFFRQSFRERLRAFCLRNRTRLKHTESTKLHGKTVSVYSSGSGTHNGDAL